jgi:hypothetical protein
VLDEEQQLFEAMKWQLPPAPGTAPIRRDHVRLYHRTHPKNMGSIKHTGLQFAKAKGIEGQRGIYADTGSKDQHGDIRAFMDQSTRHPRLNFTPLKFIPFAIHLTYRVSMKCV